MKRRLTHGQESAVYLSIIAALIAAAFVLVWPAVADDPDPTVVTWRGAGCSFCQQTNPTPASIPPTDLLEDATEIVIAEADYLWIEWKSGPQACIFTASPDGPSPVQYAGGGRNLYDGSAHAYIQPGHWKVMGASGKACAGYDVPECTGICN